LEAVRHYSVVIHERLSDVLSDDLKNVKKLSASLTLTQLPEEQGTLFSGDRSSSGDDVHGGSVDYFVMIG
jgi:hypothetical protein